jgi:hypothetical protein
VADARAAAASRAKRLPFQKAATSERISFCKPMTAMMTFSLLVIEHPLSDGEQQQFKLFCLVHEKERRLCPMFTFELSFKRWSYP